MQISIVTRHAIPNYGSFLQAYASQMIVEGLGYQCDIINYIPNNETPQNWEKTILKHKSYNRNFFLKLFYLLIRQPISLLAGKHFEKMQKQYLHLTKRYSSLAELEQDKPCSDIYMTGSDQTWGPVIDGSYDSAYCLSFTGDKDRRVAFAASFGRTKFTPEIEAYYKKYLSRYEAISVREDSAVQLLNAWGIEAKQVLDPTLVVERAVWERLAKPIKLQPKKYILVYQIGHNRKMDEYAKKAAKRAKLPLVRVSAYLHQITRGGRFVYCPDVGEFLSYIKNAACLITDSFHGTAFALNFNTPFVEILPGETSTRNMSILRLTGLTDRVLQNDSDFDLAMRPIDFTYANRVLAEKRGESLSVLKEMLGDRP